MHEKTNRTLFKCVISDLERYCHFDRNMTLSEQPVFVLFSYEPFGFVFPDKIALKGLGNKALSKKYHQRDQAKEIYRAFIADRRKKPLIANFRDAFLREFETISDKLSPWCEIVRSLEELENVLDNYMSGHNVSWECDTIIPKQEDIYMINLWIHLETENISMYKKLYKP